jgi:hypothetical protein
MRLARWAIGDLTGLSGVMIRVSEEGCHFGPLWQGSLNLCRKNAADAHTRLSPNYRKWQCSQQMM